MDGSTTSISVDPRQQLDDVVDFVNDSWLASTDFDGPTFLWNHMISDASAQDDEVVVPSVRDHLPHCHRHRQSPVSSPG